MKLGTTWPLKLRGARGVCASASVVEDLLVVPENCERQGEPGLADQTANTRRKRTSRLCVSAKSRLQVWCGQISVKARLQLSGQCPRTIGQRDGRRGTDLMNS